ncbi:MAG: M28 family peptidase [Verrucomicrobiae bacterium]|nr:M28 family peptidase [Verrucomicrobiae bacterium]
MTSRLLAAPLAFLLAAVACRGSEAWRAFDSERALAHVRKLVEIGPRPSGSPEIERTREYLTARLHEAGLKVRRQTFMEPTPRGPIEFVNLIAEVPGRWTDHLPWRRPKTLLLASHYDTKWMPEIRFVGANDGGSSAATLVEIGRVAAAARLRPWGCRLELIFFDGEEAVRAYSPEDGLHGSRYFVRRAKKTGALDRIRALILLDMIGDRDLSVLLPRGDPDLTRRIFAAAASLGMRENFRYSPSEILDDHAPFAAEGVPALNLIDFDYGPSNAWWHTAEDTLDKIRARSLEIVGKTLLKALETEDGALPSISKFGSDPHRP